MTGNGCISFYQSIMNQNDHQNLCLVFMSFRSRSKQCDLFLKKNCRKVRLKKKPDTLRNPMALFFSSRIFVVKGQPPENYLNQQRCQQFGRVLSYPPGQTLMIYVQNIFHFVNSVPKVIFCMN